MQWAGRAFQQHPQQRQPFGRRLLGTGAAAPLPALLRMHAVVAPLPVHLTLQRRHPCPTCSTQQLLRLHTPCSTMHAVAALLAYLPGLHAHQCSSVAAPSTPCSALQLQHFGQPCSECMQQRPPRALLCTAAAAPQSALLSVALRWRPLALGRLL